jgi:hypothetical protein
VECSLRAFDGPLFLSPLRHRWGLALGSAAQEVQGRLWRPGDPLKADETKVFSCSRPYSVIEWDPEVKYEVPATTPDAIAVRATHTLTLTACASAHASCLAM